MNEFYEKNGKLYETISKTNLKNPVTKVIEKINNKRNGSTPLYDAVQNSNKTLVELLLRHGADPNIKVDGDTALFVAALDNKDSAIVDLLLQYGADPNVKDDE